MEIERHIKNHLCNDCSTKITLIEKMIDKFTCSDLEKVNTLLQNKDIELIYNGEKFYFQGTKGRDLKDISTYWNEVYD